MEAQSTALTLYDILDHRLGSRLDQGFRRSSHKMSNADLDLILFDYVGARRFDALYDFTVGNRLSDQPGRLRIYLDEFDTSIHPSRNAQMLQPLLLAHGLVIPTDLLHHLALRNYEEARRSLILMGELRDLADVGALEWREPPYLGCDYAVDQNRAVVPSTQLHLMQSLPPGPFDVGFSSLDPRFRDLWNDRFDWQAASNLASTTAARMRPLASAGVVTRMGGSTRETSAIISWMLNALTLSRAQMPGLISQEEWDDLERIFRRLPQLLNGDIPDVHPQISMLFRLELRSDQITLNDVVRLRRDSAKFFEWRNALSDALETVSGMEIGDLDLEGWQRAARQVVSERLAPYKARLEKELAGSALKRIGTGTIRPLTVSGIGLGVGAVAGASTSAASVSAIAGAAAATSAYEWLKSSRQRKTLRAEAAHFAVM